MANIFISYSNKDREILERLRSDLSSFNHSLIFDENVLEAGKSFVDVLNDAMNKADGFIFIFTPNSVLSTYVMKEFGVAETLIKNANKFLIPIVAENTEVPSFVRNFHYLKLEDPLLVRKIQESIDRALPVKPNMRTDQHKTNPDSLAQNSSQAEIATDSNADRNYWFLKLNPGTWKLTDLEKYQANHDEALFGTHNLENEKRVDYELFFQVKEGDLAIGYAFGEKRSVVCLFEIISGVNVRKEVGEVIALRIRQVLSPSIPVEFISNLLPFRDRLEAEDPERLFPLSAELYEAIIGADQVGYTTQESYITNYTTEGDHRSTTDQLSFSADIASFGTVICLKKVKPPLAIGLFGRWGSGKSFFMDKLADHIDKLADTQDERYVRHVVQVRFNSWHYSDANLWASLITEIFEALNTFAGKQGKGSEIEKLSATLQLTSLHKAEAEQKRKELDEKVSALRQKQQEKRARLEDLSGLKILKTLFSDPSVRKDIDSLQNGGIEAIKQHQAQVDGYIQELDTFWGRIKLFGKQLGALRGVRWLWLIIAAVTVFIITYLIHTDFSLQWDKLTLWFSVRTGLIAVALGKVVEAIKTHGKVFQQINERWTSLKKTFDDRPQEPDAVLNATEQELLTVTESLKTIDLKLDKTQREIADISSGKKLLEFIDQKSRDEGYARQLGLIASIRKDFQILDKLLREQHLAGIKNTADNPENVELAVDRIVLYIDDLDRCNEEIVVRVLEAIHLLLAFPLFVVVVGVDPRWLNNALNKKYSELFHSSAKQQNLTSYDYLEKIFQIPFTLKEADQNDRKRLLQYLMREELVKSDLPEIATQEPAPVAIPAAVSVPVVSAADDQPLVSAEDSAAVLNKVDFRMEELAYMEGISGMFGQTPRMMNRYVNIYRIIKSHKNYQVALIPSARDYQSTLFVLAIIVGCPEQAKVFVDLLERTPDERMLDFVLNLEHDELKAFISAHTDRNDVSELSTIIVKKNLPLISRFSFRTYESAVIDEPLTAAK